MIIFTKCYYDNWKQKWYAMETQMVTERISKAPKEGYKIEKNPIKQKSKKRA